MRTLLASAAALAVVAGSVLAANVWIARRPPAATPIRNGAPVALPTAGALPRWEPAPPTDAEALARPLFSPTRRPYAPPAPVTRARDAVPVAAPEPAPVALDPPAVRLLGIRNDRGVPSALLGRQEGIATWVGIGDVVTDWTVSVVTPRSVTLERLSQTHTIELFDAAR